MLRYNLLGILDHILFHTSFDIRFHSCLDNLYILLYNHQNMMCIILYNYLCSIVEFSQKLLM